MPSEYRVFFDWGSIVAGVLAVVWLLRYKSKGPRAFAMALACLAFVAVCQLLSIDAPLWTVIASTVLMLSLLLIDVVMRMAERGDGKK